MSQQCPRNLRCCCATARSAASRSSGNDSGNVEEQHGRHQDRIFEDGHPVLFPGDDLKWGLSYSKQGPAGRSAGTLSWCGLANTYFWVDPAKRVAGVICTQILPFVDPRVMSLYTQFESGVYKSIS